MRVIKCLIGGALGGVILFWFFMDFLGLGGALLKGIDIVFGSAPMQLRGNFYALGALIGAVFGLIRGLRPKSGQCCHGGSKEPRPPAPAIKP
jgi:hypothetical protein